MADTGNSLGGIRNSKGYQGLVSACEAEGQMEWAKSSRLGEPLPDKSIRQIGTTRMQFELTGSLE
jgi:hypothetical protein